MLSFAEDVGDYVNDQRLKPDYSRNTWEVYVGLVKWHIWKYKNLDVLGYCTSDEENYWELPAWVPDWTVYTHMSPLLKYLDPLQRPLKPTYAACGPFSNQLTLTTPFPELPKTLLLSGLFIAEVRHVHEPVVSAWGNSDVEERWAVSIDSPDAHYAFTDETWRDAFDRTLVADIHAVRMHVNTYLRIGKSKNHASEKDIGLTSVEDQKAATKERRLIQAGRLDEKDHTWDSKHLLGLARDDVQVGDQIWALKGGKVLYALREIGRMANTNVLDAPEPGVGDRELLLCLSGVEHPWAETIVGRLFEFKGECYVHGLMNGEGLEYAARPKHDRPPALSDVAGDFKEIFVGLSAETRRALREKGVRY